MNHLLKSSRIKQSMQMDQESVRETDSLDQIRTDIAKLSDEIKSDSQHDQRQSTLEGIMLRVKDAIDRAAQMDDKEDSAKDQDMKNMSKMCEDMQSEIDSLKAERLSDAHVLGSARAETAKYLALYEAEKRARIIAENSHASMMGMCEKQNAIIAELTKEDAVEAKQGSWKIVPVKDTAGNVLRYDVGGS